MNLDNNFPAPLQVLMFLGSATLEGMFLLLTIYGAVRRRRWVRIPVAGLAIGVAIYFGLLLTFSAVSTEKTLSRGEEKYFCEMDCHLGYSVQDVKESAGPSGARQIRVTLRTRFDEKTVSSRRPKDAPLTPNPRLVRLADRNGMMFTPSGQEGIPLEQALVPGQSYTTALVFQVPNGAEGLRLLVTAEGGPAEVLIGNEMSLLHKKTYLAL